MCASYKGWVSTMWPMLFKNCKIILKIQRQWVPHGVEVEHWLCKPRVSGSNPGAGNLEKQFIWMKIHGLAQKQTVTDL